jgi:hypothetical protein
MVWLYLSPSDLFVSQRYLSLCLLVEGEKEDGCLCVLYTSLCYGFQNFRIIGVALPFASRKVKVLFNILYLYL